LIEKILHRLIGAGLSVSCLVRIANQVVFNEGSTHNFAIPPEFFKTTIYGKLDNSLDEFENIVDTTVEGLDNTEQIMKC
jgi:hypothetical protein